MLSSGFVNGYCEVIYPDGNTYRGEMKDGIRHGKGIFSDCKTKETFDGLFQEGYKVSGSLTFANGTRYEGDFIDERFQGNGIIVLPDGSQLTS